MVRKNKRKESRVAALRAEGWSIRAIAAELRIPQTRVFRILATVAAENAPAAPDDIVTVDNIHVDKNAASPAETDPWDDFSTDELENHDPGDQLLTSLLSASDMAFLGVTAEDLDGLKGDELLVYRMTGFGTTILLPSSPAAKAREKLSGRKLALWLYKQAGGTAPAEYLGPGGPVPIAARDARIVELARSGWKQVDIAAEVGMTQGAVSSALKRIAMELQRDPLVGPRLHRHPKTASEDW